jgi:hypothetical protein
LTLRGATVLGIGSMIGAGIFALLGGVASWLGYIAAIAGLSDTGSRCRPNATSEPSRWRWSVEERCGT